MLHVSFGALVSLVIIMLICFVLPFLLFYFLYRFADGRVKTFLIGAAAYLVCGIVVDTTLAALLELLGEINGSGVLYLLYAVVLSPACFILLNYVIIKRFGADHMKTTGDSLMYSVGYSTALNLLSTGFVAVMYFITLLDIRDRSGSYQIVSDADYVSASNAVSASNLVNESVYNEMVKLCSEPISYYLVFIINCLWTIAVFAAIMPVIWLAVKKQNKPIILVFAVIIRLFITLPDLLNRFHAVNNQWVLQLIMLAILVIVWVAAIYCRRLFIDTEDAVWEDNQKKK